MKEEGKNSGEYAPNWKTKLLYIVLCYIYITELHKAPPFGYGKMPPYTTLVSLAGSESIWTEEKNST